MLLPDPDSDDRDIRFQQGNTIYTSVEYPGLVLGYVTNTGKTNISRSSLRKSFINGISMSDILESPCSIFIKDGLQETPISNVISFFDYAVDFKRYMDYGPPPFQNHGLQDATLDFLNFIKIPGAGITPSQGFNVAVRGSARAGALTANAITPSSRALGRALEAAGHVKPPASAAHHIVAGAAAGAQQARKKLADLGIGINDAVNGVFLPISQHSPLHTDYYYGAVNAALAGVNTKSEALSVLHSIAQSLQAGKFP
jgi:hypothetical protein